MRSSYYNENDPYAAQWLRNLINAGHIAPGDVDERSIVDVRPDDLRGYRQCHFFAGIGGWSIALRLAGWDRPVWTGSCPCQPFSAAGKGKAADDERHLWPSWFSLIQQCRPATVFGEQVEAAIGWGWLDAVFNDLEKEGYACGATVLPAVGAPHIRQRLWFVADAADERHERNGTSWHRRGGPGELVNTESEQVGIPGRTRQPRATDFWSDLEWLPCTDGKARPTFSRIQFVAPRLSAGMVSGGTGKQKEIVNGTAAIAGREKELPCLRGAIGAEKIQECTGGSDGIQSQEVLQSNLHGCGNEWRHQENECEEQPPPIRKSQDESLLALWRYITSACSPLRRESIEQQAVELDDIVRALSHARTLARMEKDEVSAAALQVLQQACEASGSMQYTLYALSDAWRRAICAPENEGWNLATGTFGLAPVSPLVDGRMLEGRSRAKMLRGIGNAIVPQTAAQFIRAVM